MNRRKYHTAGDCHCHTALRAFNLCIAVVASADGEAVYAGAEQIPVVADLRFHQQRAVGADHCIARTRALTSASFIDKSTQLLNRRAFEEKKAELAEAGLKELPVYITADLNGLKRVNDNLGHTAGDELIKGAADCLKECFGKYSDVYRIGGDEFAAMLRMSDAGLKDAMARLDRTTENWSGQQVKSLSISCGSSSSREFPPGNIGDLIRISDERMYAAKAAYYARTGIDRRK